MVQNVSFAQLIDRVRQGDDAAAADLVRRYEPEIRREVRLRLSDPTLRRIFDSTDVCQSVMASFFVRAVAGQYELERPEQLLRLLVTMARNKVADQSRRQQARRRDHRRSRGVSTDERELAAASPSPSRIVAGRELLAEVRRLLSPEERRLADLRGLGQAWDDIAAELGGTAEARRKQLSRALDRVALQLGLDAEGL
jgi:RNA polymerase sigma-70 factor (ECF subfamily)